MIPTVLVTDTHPLVWFLAGEHRKLSDKVRGAFERAVEGAIAIWVPTVVLWEMSILVKLGKIRFLVPFEELIQEQFYGRAIHVADLMMEDVIRAHDLNFSRDLFDVMIVAVALRLDCALITKDSVIQNTGPCSVFWD